VWWSQSDDYVEFHDVTNHPSTTEDGPQLHHFRSSSLDLETAYLEDSWRECLARKTVIPTNIIRIDDADGTTTRLNTNFLNPDEEHESVNPNEEHESLPPRTGILVNANSFTGTHNNSQNEETQECTIAQERQDEDEVNEDIIEEEVVVDLYPKHDEIISFEDNILPLPPTESKCLSDSVTKQTNHFSSYHTTESTECEQVKLNEHHQEVIDPKQCNDRMLKTSLGKALKVVLGHTEEVQSLDNQHYKLKKLMKQNNDKRDKQLGHAYEEAFANMQAKVLREKSIAEKKLKTWEKEYVINHDLKAPSLEDMKRDNESSTLLKQIKYADAMLSNWKIHF
jgi:hypothetical protein